MTYSLTWLPKVLEDANLKVAETPGWRTRGRAEMGKVLGVICHHTATKHDGNMPTLDMLIAGRPDLKGPLAQLGLGRDGTFYVIAAGRANHAGVGEWRGVKTGNSSFIGIEAENSGAEPWPAVQLDAYQRGVAAILKEIGANAYMCCGHKEFALPLGRKIDPAGIDMGQFRTAVGEFLDGKTPPPLIPAVDASRRPTIRQGSKGEWVEVAQALLKVDVDGDFGGGTAAAMRAFQRSKGLVDDAIVGPKTWEALDTVAPGGKATAPEPAAPVAPATPAATSLPMAEAETHQPHVAGANAIGPDGTVFAHVYKPGFVQGRGTSVTAWFTSRDIPPSSACRVLAAVCPNEGAMEAINSYDNAHMSFGIMQWTAGPGGGNGELGSLLARLKATDPTAFNECFGRYGLDARLDGPGSATGPLLLNGRELKTSSDKKPLRSVEWAYRFWRAGHHPRVREVEFEHAVGRFAALRKLTAAGRPVADWLTSELGMAHLLDQHINRPGEVRATVAKAVTAVFGASPPDPAAVAAADEQRLINAYLVARKTTTMTDSEDRAKRISNQAALGKLSSVRGSFV